MAGKFLNIDTDATLAGNSDIAVSSQKAIKTYVDTGLTGKINTSAKGAASGVASLDSNATIPDAQIPYKYIKENDILQNLNIHNTSGKHKLWFSSLDNTLYRANRRHTVTLTNFNTDIATNLFDMNWDSEVRIPAGSIGTINISGNSNLGMQYPYGYIYISFYGGNGPTSLSQLSAKVYQDWSGHNTGWVNLGSFEAVSTGTYNNIEHIKVARVFAQVYGIKQIEINIDNTDGVGHEDTKIWVTQVEFFCNRTGVQSLPVLTKLGGDTIYGSLTIPTENGSFIGNLTGTAAKAIKDADGNTISSSYLKLTGGTLSGPLTIVKTSGNSFFEMRGSNSIITLIGGYGTASQKDNYIRGSDSDLRIYGSTLEADYGLKINNTTGKLYHMNGAGNHYELLDTSNKAVANGLATLDANTKIPTTQLPIATTSALGAVKADGTTITVDENGVITATGGGSSADSYQPPLLSYTWSDHKFNDIQWLRADTFSWQNGNLYEGVYNKLTEEYNGHTPEVFVQTKIDGNGVIGGPYFAAETSSQYDSGLYKAFDLTNTDNAVSNFSNEAYLTFYNPSPLLVTQLVWTTYDNDRNPTDYSVAGSNDNVTYTTLISHGTATAGAATTMNLSSNTNYYRYYKITGHTFNTSMGNLKTLAITASVDTSNKVLYKEPVWTQPILTQNGTLGESTCAVATDVAQYNDNQIYNAFTPNYTGNAGFHSVSGTTSGYVTYYSPDPVKITAITFTNQTDSSSSNRASTGGNISVSDNGFSWRYLKSYSNSEQSIGGVWTIDLSSNTNYYKYYKITCNGTNSSYWTFKSCAFTAVTFEKEFEYHHTPSGLRITTPEYEPTLIKEQAATGTSWYYILDTGNVRFKLPRFTDKIHGELVEVYHNGAVFCRTYEDGWCEQGGLTTVQSNYNCNGTFYKNFIDTSYFVTVMGQARSGWLGITSKSVSGFSCRIEDGGGLQNMFYACGYVTTPSNYADEQRRLTHKYLYFFVGGYAQEAIVQTAGITSEQLNEKVDIANMEEVKCVVETYNNNGSWYRIWSDGWCEQGGYYGSAIPTDGQATIQLLKPFSDTNYHIYQQTYGSTSGAEGTDICVKTDSKTTTMFILCNEGYVATMSGLDWKAEGYIS